jgi:hypothetical protein
MIVESMIVTVVTKGVPSYTAIAGDPDLVVMSLQHEPELSCWVT